MKFKTIKVYNIREYIENLKFNNEKYSIAVDSKLAIIEGTNGVIIINEEGCGRLTKSIDSEYEIDLIKENKVYFGKPDYTNTMTVKEIIANVPYEEMLLTDFMDNWQYKMRIRDNLLEILGLIRKIGLNSTKYCTKGYINKNYQGRYF